MASTIAHKPLELVARRIFARVHGSKAYNGLASRWNADLKSASHGPVGKIAGHSASGDAADFKSAFHFRYSDYAPWENTP
jgi:hypothetical protein